MRAFWALLLVASLFGLALHPRRARRAHPVATLSATAVGHHHHVRAHRVSTTVAQPPSLVLLPRVVIEPALAPIIEAPIALLDAPVARGPPARPAT
ncbi:MAG TPA: hypothetical protein VGL61_34450 [Kofleriaceae bacterium]|jgi:hypothetical protein